MGLGDGAAPAVLVAWRSGFDRRTGVRTASGSRPRRDAGPRATGRGPSTRFRLTTETELNRTEKGEFIQSLAAVFADTSFVLVGQNNGLTVAAVDDLRRRMRSAGATYKVAKNRLAVRALDGTRFEGIAPLLKGPTALAWATDPVAVAKTAVDYAKINEKFVILGGALGPQTLNPDGVRALAELPSLETLRAQLLGLIQTPATRIAGVLQAPGAQLARVFSAFAKKDEAEGGAEAA